MNCLYACMYECMYELFVCMNVLFVCMCVYVPGMVRSPDAAPLNLTIGDIYKDFSVNFSLPIVSNPISSNPVTTLEKENIRHTTRYNDVDLIGQATLADPVGVIFRSEETAPTIPIKPIVRLGPPLRMYIYVCMYVYMEVSMYVCMYVCMYFIYKDFIKCMYGMYVCMYVVYSLLKPLNTIRSLSKYKNIEPPYSSTAAAAADGISGSGPHGDQQQQQQQQQPEEEEADADEEENSLYIESALENVKHLMHVEESRGAGDRGSHSRQIQIQIEEDTQQDTQISEAAAGFSPPIVNKELLDALLEQPEMDNADNTTRAHNISLLKDAYRSHTSSSSSSSSQLTLDHPLLSGSTSRDRILPVSPDSANRSGTGLMCIYTCIYTHIHEYIYTN